MPSSTTFRFMIYSDESETLGGLLACANKYAAADDDNREGVENRRCESGKKKIEDQAGPSDEVAATVGKGGSGNGKWQNKKPASNQSSRPPMVKYDDIKHNPCVHHLRPDGTKSHTIQQCHINWDISKDPKAGKSRNKRKSRKDGKEKEDAASESDDADRKSVV